MLRRYSKNIKQEIRKRRRDGLRFYFLSPISINRTFADKQSGHLTNPTNFRLLVIKFRLTTPVSWPQARCLVSFAKILPLCPTVQFSGVIRIKVALHARHSINQPTNNFPAIRLNFLPAIRCFLYPIRYTPFNHSPIL